MTEDTKSIIKIFLKNKALEIVEGVLIILAICGIVIAILATGYLLCFLSGSVSYLFITTTTWDKLIALKAGFTLWQAIGHITIVGLLINMVLVVFGFGIYIVVKIPVSFVKWIRSNWKKAIAEHKDNIKRYK